MKKTFKLFLLLFCVMLSTSCDSDEKNYIQTSFFGSVDCSKSTVRNGEEVEISMGNFKISSDDISVEVGTTTEINGKDVLKGFSYYINGHKIGESFEKANNYLIKYRVENLTPATYEITSECIPASGNITIDASIQSFKITVIE